MCYGQARAGCVRAARDENTDTQTHTHQKKHHFANRLDQHCSDVRSLLQTRRNQFYCCASKTTYKSYAIERQIINRPLTCFVVLSVCVKRVKSTQCVHNSGQNRKHIVSPALGRKFAWTQLSTMEHIVSDDVKKKITPVDFCFLFLTSTDALYPTDFSMFFFLFFGSKLNMQ